MEPPGPSKEAGARNVSDDDSASSGGVTFVHRAYSASYLLPALPAPELQQRLVPPPPTTPSSPPCAAPPAPPPASHDAFLASVRRTPRAVPSEPKLHSAWGGDEPELPRPRLEALLAKLEASLSSNPASAASAAFLLAHDEVLARKVRVAPTLGRERKLTSCF